MKPILTNEDKLTPISKNVGQFTVSGGKTINTVVFYETQLPDGDYKLIAQAKVKREKGI